MWKKALGTALLSAGVLLTAACSHNESILKNNNENSYQRVGFYAGKGIDHDGPIKELLDYSTGSADHINDNNFLLPSGHPDAYGKYTSLPEREYSKTMHNPYLRDINYHGHLNDVNSAARSSYYNAYEGRLAEDVTRAAGSVPNIRSARTIVNRNHIIVALILKNQNQRQETKSEAKAAAAPYTKGRKLILFTDDGTYYRIRSLDNDLRNGGPHIMADKDIKDILKNQK
ncbi:YhcN/YlaJ family sporulation lipoprotein [Heyndrickxia acidicola]|uniref:YhcN/YlaJ family sporulation lipoprotein n=1 Tax=Heyndrickxia acidicola TaxID=209389 RepID=A0ABU6MJC4_9BACI|nr:YhcN/YlaJ family sporulation lipoprotein [Heyndrickxia acidicola]MED1204769.1 YhcN/YlaJ family sporulation lipoprotein [Heyndrickxia acidicola]